MKHWLAVPSLALALCLTATGLCAQALAADAGRGKPPKTKVFESLQARL